MRFSFLACGLAIVLSFGCGDDGNGGGGGGGGDGGLVDGDGSVIIPDGGITFDDGGIVVGPSCSPTSTECNNCEDDDMDGLIDGQDFECISPLDDDESSFATGIPGDNKDAKKQDCFFDGDSGAGNDGCDINVCCLLDNCPGSVDCSLSQKCIDNCSPLTAPHCDCFGCCTFCPDGTNCYDIIINPAVSPDCDETVIDDPDKCLPCVKQTDCGPPEDCANPGDCILCAGENPENLPPECNGMNECPDGQQTCTQTADCPDTQYCNQGCCNDGFIVQ